MASLVTGASGFIGSHVVRALLAEGEQVRVLVRPTSDGRNLTGLAVESVLGDLRDARSVAEAVEGCEVVYHVAALYSSQLADAAEMYAVNVGGTKSMLQAALAAGVQRVVLTSTVGTIGRPADGSLPSEEDHYNLWATASDYVKSKYLSEVAALRVAQRDGLPLVIVHPCAPIGAGDLKPTVTGQRIVDFLQGKRPSYVSGGINLVAVMDVAQGHVLAARLGRPGERYILGNAQGNLDEEAFLQLLAQATGQPVPEPEPARRRAFWRRRGQSPAGTKPAALTADPSKAIRELGLPQTRLGDAFSEAVDWFRQN